VSGTLFGLGAALCWAAGWVAARHGVLIGFAPADLVLYRFLVPGLLLLPLIIRAGFFDLGGIGWRRGILLAVLGGPGQSLASYMGLTFAPLGHGLVIPPACSTLGGLALAALILHEHLSWQRLFGALAIISGLVVLGVEAMAAFGREAVLGDMLFVTSGLLWAAFSVALKSWSIAPQHAVAVISVVALLIYTPIHAVIWGYDSILAAPLSENLLQIVMQGLIAAALPIYLFARAVVLLGAGRAASFAAFVPVFGMLIGALTIGELPTLVQIAGLAIVVTGFHFALKP
jgi:drug/metabolite transporter (DMT)-like permease